MRADLVYLDLGMSSMQVDTRERGFSYAYDAPLDMRMDPDQELDRARDRQHVGRAPPGARCCASFGEERYAPPDRARDRARARDRPIETTHELVERSPPRSPRRRASPAATRPSAASRRCGSPSTTSSAQLDAALPLAWEAAAQDGRFAGISFHSLEDRRVKRFLADRAQGCICPPDLPVCVCGREPEAELLTRRAVVAHAGEVAAQPALEVGAPARRAQARRGAV